MTLHLLYFYITLLLHKYLWLYFYIKHYEKMRKSISWLAPLSGSMRQLKTAVLGGVVAGAGNEIFENDGWSARQSHWRRVMAPGNVPFDFSSTWKNKINDVKMQNFLIKWKKNNSQVWDSLSLVLQLHIQIYKLRNILTLRKIFIKICVSKGPKVCFYFRSPRAARSTGNYFFKLAFWRESR